MTLPHKYKEMRHQSGPSPGAEQAVIDWPSLALASLTDKLAHASKDIETNAQRLDRRSNDN